MFEDIIKEFKKGVGVAFNGLVKFIDVFVEKGESLWLAMISVFATLGSLFLTILLGVCVPWWLNMLVVAPIGLTVSFAVYRKTHGIFDKQKIKQDLLLFLFLNIVIGTVLHMF